MRPQNFELRNQKIKEKFLALKREEPERFQSRLNLSWSNWTFGLENLSESVQRLKRNGVSYLELPGNRYGTNLGYEPATVQKILSDNGMKVSGICGIFSEDNDLSSPRGVIRQNAIDYIRRNVELGRVLDASYFVVVPGAVGRSVPIDSMEMERSAETLRLIADVFLTAPVRAAVEPIRSSEASFCHTVEEAQKYIRIVNHPGVQHITGDTYHMISEESHVAEAIIKAGKQLINLHLTDSNRGPLGEGCLDLDTVIMALYVSNYNREDCFVTPEPLAPETNVYATLNGRLDRELLEKLVQKTISYFREREEEVLSL